MSIKVFWLIMECSTYEFAIDFEHHFSTTDIFTINKLNCLTNSILKVEKLTLGLSGLTFHPLHLLTNHLPKIISFVKSVIYCLSDPSIAHWNEIKGFRYAHQFLGEENS